MNRGRWYVMSRREAFAKRDSMCRRQLHTIGGGMRSCRLRENSLSRYTSVFLYHVLAAVVY